MLDKVATARPNMMKTTYATCKELQLPAPRMYTYYIIQYNAIIYYNKAQHILAPLLLPTLRPLPTFVRSSSAGSPFLLRQSFIRPKRRRAATRAVGGDFLLSRSRRPPQRAATPTFACALCCRGSVCPTPVTDPELVCW